MTQRTVMRYIQASKGGEGPLMASQAELPMMVVSREAALPVEFGVTGSELMRKLRQGAEKFIRAMELQGLTLIPLPHGNPLCVTNEDGTPRATFSMTHDLEKTAPDQLLDAESGGKGPDTLKVPSSLEDSKGMVDYRMVGVFWAPQVSIEIAKTREQIRAEEKASRNPSTWGSGKSVPTTPSIAIARR